MSPDLQSRFRAAGFSADSLDEEFATRFASRENDGLSVAPAYLMRDARNEGAVRGEQGEILTVSNATTQAQKEQLKEDGQRFEVSPAIGTRCTP